MAFLIQLEDDTGAVAGKLFLGEFDRSYLLPDGRRCRMPQRVAWCRDCDKYVAAENVRSLEDIDMMLAAFKAGPAALRQHLMKIGETYSVRYASTEELVARARRDFDDWMLLRDWRRLRRSPARCLDCFSTEIDPVPEGSNETVHPISRKKLSIGGVAHIELADHYEYSVEGLPLPKKWLRGRVPPDPSHEGIERADYE